ncbi:MAG: imidazole glycerol phosphate synthase subunit HisH [Gemmatimonadaceae bacterium]
MRVAILDYGAGNLHSLAKAARSGGADVSVTGNVVDALETEAILLPGVGAFGSAIEFLDPYRDRIRVALDAGLPCLGICLGMQLLFDSSEEGPGLGLGVIAGKVRRLGARRVPQIGWNTLEDARDPLLCSTGLETAYFANSYVCEPVNRESVTAWATHEADHFPAVVRARNVVGVQFHPEKSSAAGVDLIRAFLAEAAR